MTSRQTGLDLEIGPRAAPTSDYRIVVCVCRTRVVVGTGVRSVACPKCRQIVSGDLLGGV